MVVRTVWSRSVHDVNVEKGNAKGSKSGPIWNMETWSTVITHLYSWWSRSFSDHSFIANFVLDLLNKFLLSSAYDSSCSTSTPHQHLRVHSRLASVTKWIITNVDRNNSDDLEKLKDLRANVGVLNEHFNSGKSGRLAFKLQAPKVD